MKISKDAPLDDYLKWFAKDINHIMADNIVIGGTVAILLHGLRYRRANDLDLIMYNPSKKQLSALTKLTDTSTVDAYGNEVRSYKIECRSLVLNFIICTDEMPPDLLEIKTVAFGHIKVQRIRTILKYKRAYGRPRDFEDITLIKDQL